MNGVGWNDPLKKWMGLYSNADLDGDVGEIGAFLKLLGKLNLKLWDLLSFI